MKKLLILVATFFIIFFTGCLKSVDLKEISYDELANKISAKDSFVLYVGSSSCSHCASFRPKLEKVMTKYKLEVYYIDMANLSGSKYNAVMEKVDGAGTPTTVYIEKGKTKTSPRIEGDSTKENIIDFFKEINYIKGE